LKTEQDSVLASIAGWTRLVYGSIDFVRGLSTALLSLLILCAACLRLCWVYQGNIDLFTKRRRALQASL